MCNITENVLHHQQIHHTQELDRTDEDAEQELNSAKKSKVLKCKRQKNNDAMQLSSTVEVSCKKIDQFYSVEEDKGEDISSTLELKRNKIDQSYSVKKGMGEDITADMDDN
jgi:hypothetical protein